MPDVDVTTETTIRCPRGVVAEYATNPEHAPRWYANIERVEWRSPPPVAVGSRIAFVAEFLGRRLAYTYEVVELVAGERLVMRTSEGPFPMETTCTWAPVDASTTRMTLRNRGRPSGFSALMAPLMATMMRRANRADLACLKRVLEAGARSALEEGSKRASVVHMPSDDQVKGPAS